MVIGERYVINEVRVRDVKWVTWAMVKTSDERWRINGVGRVMLDE